MFVLRTALQVYILNLIEGLMSRDERSSLLLTADTKHQHLMHKVSSVVYCSLTNYSNTYLLCQSIFKCFMLTCMVLMFIILCLFFVLNVIVRFKILEYECFKNV